MDNTESPQPDYAAVIRDWQSQASMFRRALAHIGLQGKLIIFFVFLILLARGTSCWMVVYQSRQILGLSATGLTREAAIHRAELLVVGLNLVALFLGIPLVTLMVKRIFEPIRELSAATDKIAAGDLNARVAIYRPDAIGGLARSFNNMMRRIRAQQQSLEQANRRLEQANHALEEKVQQRTLQLQAAIERLNFEISEKEDFLRAISHDLSAPLRNISGMTTMLLRKKGDGFDSEVVHRLERIQKNAEVEAGLICELLELSKIKTRRQRMEEIDLNELVGDLAGVFENDFQSQGIRFLVDSPLPVVRCEKPRMRQLFQNLIDNAIKYMGEGRVDSGAGGRLKQIRIGASVQGDEADFYVEDTGIGIDAEDKESIFYVFRRGRNSAVRSIAGKGVGLASVKNIVQTYNGTIWVESEVGRGSTFRFTINGKFLVESRTLVGAM